MYEYVRVIPFILCGSICHAASLQHHHFAPLRVKAARRERERHSESSSRFEEHYTKTITIISFGRTILSRLR